MDADASGDTPPIPDTLREVLERGNRAVFLDITVGGRAVGRISLELFTGVAPRTCENFRQLCTGEYKPEGVVPVGYKGCPVHRVVKGFVVQGGDVLKGDGTGTASIYGAMFEDEAAGLAVKHSGAGLLSMANSGPNTNGCQFFLTLAAAAHLDGKHVVFGRVLDRESMIVLQTLEHVPVDASDRPTLPCLIAESGEL